jgi:hypothetical protein
MNMAFSGVAGSRPAREGPLADGDGKSTIKGAKEHLTADENAQPIPDEKAPPVRAGLL